MLTLFSNMILYLLVFRYRRIQGVYCNYFQGIRSYPVLQMLTVFASHFAYLATQIMSFCIGNLADLVLKHLQCCQMFMSQYYTAYGHMEKHSVPKRQYWKVQWRACFWFDCVLLNHAVIYWCDVASAIDGWTSTEWWWNDIEVAQPNYLEKY
jgi:hypothetical protein